MPISAPQNPNPRGGYKMLMPETHLGVMVSSLTSSGTTATCVTATAHGKTTGQSVTIWGADQGDYNGTVTITVTNATTFTYAITQQIASPDVDTATGTIWAQTTSAGTTTYAEAYEGGQRMMAVAMNWPAGSSLDFIGLASDYPLPCFFLNFGGDPIDVSAGGGTPVTVPAAAIREFYINPESTQVLEI